MPLNSGEMISTSRNHYLWAHLFPGKEHSAQVGQWVQAHHVSFPGILCRNLRKSCTFFLHLSRDYNTCQKSFIFARFLKMSWWNAIYTAVVLPAETCRFVGGFIQTSPCSSFPDLAHKNGSMAVPGLAGEWLVFKYSIPVKDGLQGASPVKVIAHPFPPIKLITWSETWSHWHSWPFEGFFEVLFVVQSPSAIPTEQSGKDREKVPGSPLWAVNYATNCPWQRHHPGNEITTPQPRYPRRSADKEPARMNFASPFPSSQGCLSL